METEASKGKMLNEAFLIKIESEHQCINSRLPYRSKNKSKKTDPYLLLIEKQLQIYQSSGTRTIFHRVVDYAFQTITKTAGSRWGQL